MLKISHLLNHSRQNIFNFVYANIVLLTLMYHIFIYLSYIVINYNIPIIDCSCKGNNIREILMDV